MPSLLILVPLLGIIVLNLPAGRGLRRAAFGVTLALGLLQVGVAAYRPAAFWQGALNPLGPFFNFGLVADELSLVLILLIGLVAVSALFVGQFSLPDEPARFNFANLLLVSLIGMNATVMVRDVFSLYVFLEVTAIASFVLIVVERGRFALEGAFKYLIMSAVATVMMLTAVGLFVLTAGGTGFDTIAAVLMTGPADPLARVAGYLFLGGLLIKAGAVPFHGWLPDAYSAAPTSVSVLLAGIVTKVSGVYALIRLVTSVIGLGLTTSQLLMAIGTLSVVVGALAALTQTDFKRMLAWSSISQVGYIVLALGCGTDLALVGAVFHFFNHAVFKSLLFVNAAALEQRLGTVNMNEMGGVAQRMPVTGVTALLAFLSTAGIPPLAGFWSKLIIVLALWFSGNIAYAVIALLASILTLAYFLVMQRTVFFGQLRTGLETVREAGAGLLIPQVVLAAITVGAGVLFPFFINAFIPVVSGLVR